MVHSSAFVVALAGVAVAAPAQIDRIVKRQTACTAPENAQIISSTLCSFVCNSGYSFVNGVCETVASIQNAQAAAASPSSAAAADSASTAAAAVASSPASSASTSQQTAQAQAQSGSSSVEQSAPAAASTPQSVSSGASTSSTTTGSTSSKSGSSSSSSSSDSSSNSGVVSSIGSALGGSVVGSDGIPYVSSGGSSQSGSSSSSGSTSAMALSGQVSGFPFVNRLNGTVQELISSGIRGFLGNNTNSIASWFRSDNVQDSTNGNSWCYYPYNDTSPGFAVSLRTMTANFYNDTMAARRAYCGLEANVYSPRTNKNVTLYVVDAFDDTWVKTPTSMDVMIGSFPLLWDDSLPAGTPITLSKNDVVFPVSWQWTGNRHPDYVFGGVGSGPRSS